MNYTTDQLDTIVRMVVERLRAMPEAATGNSRVTLRETQPPKTEPPRKLATIHEVSGHADTTTLTLAEKVITTETFADRLGGIARVLVAKGSVVTPAARDWLRERNIKLQIGGKPVANPNCPLVIGSDCESIRPADVAGTAASDCLPQASCWKPLLADVAQKLNGSRRLGAIISTHAAAVLCAANRNRAIRAIGASAIGDVTSAKGQIGANLLVIDPTGRGTHAIRQMIAAFARDGYLDPPREWED